MLNMLLMIPPAPFINSKLEIFNFATEMLLKPQNQSITMQNQMQNLACISAVSSSKLALYISAHLRDQLEAAATALLQKEITPQHQTLIGFILRNTLCLANNQKVKTHLQTNKMPLRLYKAIKEDDPIKAGRIIRQLEPKLKTIVLRFVLKISSENAELERELTQEVLRDMDHLTTITDPYFIEHVFSQFLHNESRLPVSIQLKAYSSGNGTEPKW
jgi:hypothetical protein